jgi:hypothetical protein
MLTRFGISVGDEDRWGYQPTLATVDQVDYHMHGFLKKSRCYAFFIKCKRTALCEGKVHPPTPYLAAKTKLFVQIP